MNKRQWQKIIKGKIKRYIEINENENTIYQNFWDATKAVKREKANKQLNITS